MKQSKKSFYNIKLLGVFINIYQREGKMILSKYENEKYGLSYAKINFGQRAGFDRPIKLIEKNKNVKGRRKQNEIDQIIRPSLSDEWTIERLEVILRAILRAGTFELITFAKVPAKVIINEYVNVARAFFDDNKPSLVNGVLDKISRVVRNAEMKNLSD